MKKQSYNPFLPLNEYIPDGEPHVFGDRVYIYGSHDKENGDVFCMLPYVTYSASIHDLKEWRYEGVIYTNVDDPNVTDKHKYMYAPDVVCGPDGRYYLYYSLEGYNQNYERIGIISVAVCDTPSGTFRYLGDVRNPDGSQFKHFCMFDPAVLNDDGKIYLYYGAGSYDVMAKIPGFLLNRMEKKMHGLSMKEMSQGKYGENTYLGGNVVELEADMLTVKSAPRRIIPDCLEARMRYPEFIGHGFFEASSIRKFNGKYYFIYSSERSHDLCYAISDYPDRDFVYQGILVSNGDVGLNGRELKDATRDFGNNHGSVEYIDGKYYIFYHRHTGQSSFSRQACAEEITMDENGVFHMVEATSCGLNGGPLEASGTYPAVIACVTKRIGKTSAFLTSVGGVKTGNPYIVCIDDERVITGIEKKTLIGFKHFAFTGKTTVTLVLRGNAKGAAAIFEDEQMKHLCTGASLNLSGDEWQEVSLTFSMTGVHPLYIGFDIDGKLDFKEFRMA